MKLYENKREITLAEALAVLLTNNVPGQFIHYMISFDETGKFIKFGKGYHPIYDCAWFIADDDTILALSPTNTDEFLIRLFDGPYLSQYFEEKQFHV